MMNLLLAGNFEYTKEQLNILKNAGYKVFLMQDERGRLPLEASEIDVVVCNWLFTHYNIKEFENLKYIQLLSAGMERIPVDYIKDKGIGLSNARGVYSIPMAEYAVCGVLQLLKQSRFFIKNQQEKKWEKNRKLEELSNKTVAIIGMGSVGIEVANRFKVFAREVIGFDINCEIKSEYSIYDIEEFDNKLSDFDILIFTVPISANTRHFLNQDRIQKMRQNAIVVNISRGGIVDEAALLNAINAGKIRGAVLDVFEEEPLVNSEIWQNENVIVTPHNSFVSDRNNERMWNVIMNNLIDTIEKD